MADTVSPKATDVSKTLTAHIEQPDQSDADAIALPPAAGKSDAPSEKLASTPDIAVKTTSAKKRSAAEATIANKVEGGSSAGSKQKKSKAAAGSGSLTGVRAYLETTVVPLLMTGMQELATVKPEDPLTWLGDYLKNNAAKGNQDAKDAAKKREAAAAAKATSAAGQAAAKASPTAQKLPSKSRESTAADQPAHAVEQPAIDRAEPDDGQVNVKQAAAQESPPAEQPTSGKTLPAKDSSAGKTTST